MKHIFCLLSIVFLIPSCKSKIPTALLEIRDDTGKVVFVSKDARHLDFEDETRKIRDEMGGGGFLEAGR